MVFICLHVTLKQNHSCAVCQEDKEEYAHVYSALDYCLFNSMNSWLILNRELDVCSFIFADTLLEYWPLQVVHSSFFILLVTLNYFYFIYFSNAMCSAERFPFQMRLTPPKKEEIIVKSYLKLVVLTLTLSLISSIFCLSKLFRATAILVITHILVKLISRFVLETSVVSINTVSGNVVLYSFSMFLGWTTCTCAMSCLIWFNLELSAAVNNWATQTCCELAAVWKLNWVKIAAVTD